MDKLRLARQRADFMRRREEALVAELARQQISRRRRLENKRAENAGLPKAATAMNDPKLAG